VIAALNDSYSIFRRRIDVERRRRRPRHPRLCCAFKIGCSFGAFLVFAWSSTSGLACWHG